MVDVTIQSPISGIGQTTATPAEEIIAKDPNAQNIGQAETAIDGPGGTSIVAPTTDPEVFFDPRELDAALQGVPESLAKQVKALEKQLRGVFTKKTESIAKERQKVEAYNAFMVDPVGQIQRLANQYGVQIQMPGNRQESITQTQQTESEWEPKTWNEVYKKFENQVMQRLQGDLRPVIDNVQKITASNIEKQLAEIDPDWKMYEDEMKGNIQKHPSLVNDVGKLYRISVPDEVLNSRAVQQALKKIQDQTAAAKVHGGHITHRSEPVLQKATSFNDAVQIAREKGKKEGWYK